MKRLAIDYKTREEHIELMCHYDIRTNAKGDLSSNEKCRKTFKANEEIARRFQMLHYKLLLRRLKTFKKFILQVVSAIPLIYESENDWNLLFNKLSWATEKNKFKKFNLPRIKTFNIVEGFICEGKSKYANETFGFDSEFDDFWRCKLRRDDETSATYLPHQYYDIFILCGIISSLYYSLNNNKNSLGLDRAWGSSELWAKQINVIGTDGNARLKTPIFDYNFYINLFTSIARPVGDIGSGQNKFTIVIKNMSRYPFPKSWIPERSLEARLYGPNPNESALFCRLAYEFFFNLSHIYGKEKHLCIFKKLDKID